MNMTFNWNIYLDHITGAISTHQYFFVLFLYNSTHLKFLQCTPAKTISIFKWVNKFIRNIFFEFQLRKFLIWKKIYQICVTKSFIFRKNKKEFLKIKQDKIYITLYYFEANPRSFKSAASLKKKLNYFFSFNFKSFFHIKFQAKRNSLGIFLQDLSTSEPLITLILLPSYFQRKQKHLMMIKYEVTFFFIWRTALLNLNVRNFPSVKNR